MCPTISSSLSPYNVDVRLIAAVQTHAGAHCHEAANLLSCYSLWAELTAWRKNTQHRIRTSNRWLHWTCIAIVALAFVTASVDAAPIITIIQGPVATDYFGRPRTVSANGLIETGSRSFGAGRPFEPYRLDKSPTGNITPLGALPGMAGLPGYGYGISADGQTVVGQSGYFLAPTQGTEQYGSAFRWTLAGGMESLGVVAQGGVFTAVHRGLCGVR